MEKTFGKLRKPQVEEKVYSAYTELIDELTLTAGTGIDITNNVVSNTDSGSGAVSTHEATYDHTKLHDRKHSITSTSDHTSTATSGKMLKADANGLPVDATNTDTDVASAVSLKHAQETATSIGALIGGSADATPNDTDYVATSLTAGGILKKITWTNVITYLRSKLDLVYAPISTKNLVTFTVIGASINPQDGLTYYMGNSIRQPLTTAGTNKIYIRNSGTITIAEIYNYSATVAGTNENVSIYIRVNNTTDTLIATVGTAANERVFSNTNVGLSVSAGDYFEIKMVCPTWATNPTGMTINGYIILSY